MECTVERGKANLRMLGLIFGFWTNIRVLDKIPGFGTNLWVLGQILGVWTKLKSNDSNLEGDTD